VKTIKKHLARHFPRTMTILRELHRQSWRFMPMEYVFTRTYEHGGWGSAESVSGRGSTLAETRRLRTELPLLIREMQIKSLLDIPCGDLNWMKEVLPSIEQYIGAEVVR
jgi:hypothetical protein